VRQKKIVGNKKRDRVVHATLPAVGAKADGVHRARMSLHASLSNNKMREDEQRGRARLDVWLRYTVQPTMTVRVPFLEEKFAKTTAPSSSPSRRVDCGELYYDLRGGFGKDEAGRAI
jgi:hypothetical protein